MIKFNKKVCVLTVSIMFLQFGLSPAHADAKQTKYFKELNKVLEILQKSHPNSKGFQAGRIMYKTPSLANSIVSDIKGMCSSYKSAYVDSKLTNPELDSIVQKYWTGERQMVDWFLSNTGNNKDALSDFMLVRFTGLVQGINNYCPTYFALTSKQFSDRLYSVYTDYVNSVP